jgi:hypothetical protein
MHREEERSPERDPEADAKRAQGTKEQQYDAGVEQQVDAVL